jgi:hypothetical protein
MLNRPVELPFREGDQVVLAEGSYQGTVGVFLRLLADTNWADITEPHGRVRCHPVAWLAHSST